MSQPANAYRPVRATLSGGSKIEFRAIARGDLDEACRFYKDLPEQDRKYLRFDVTDREAVDQRIRLNERWGKLRRLVAVEKGRIIGTGVLELHEGWKGHVAEMRLIVGQDQRRKGLAKLIAGELFKIAAAEQVEEIVVQMMQPQDAAHGIFKRLGFRDEIVLRDHVRDQTGAKQDLRIMRCPLKTLWQEMENFAEHYDTRRHR